MDMNNNIINKYNLQKRTKWRKINFYKKVKLLNKNIWEMLVKALFNKNNDESSCLSFFELFVSCLYF